MQGAKGRRRKTDYAGILDANTMPRHFGGRGSTAQSRETAYPWQRRSIVGETRNKSLLDIRSARLPCRV